MITRAWHSWKRIARKVGNFQAQILLTVFYATLMLPFGIGVRLLLDPLRIKKRPARWLDHPEETQDLQWAKRL
ncbi:MAG TPA: hypothetical protein VGQ81_08455 [Acidobacteriota bacterium]|jgi:hypothetical protein|nr:hypothetical protein [Acidobacteriota bacterium]